MINSPLFRKILAIAFLLALPVLFLVRAAYQAYPCPFETTLMGQSIRFPLSIGKFQKEHPTIKSVSGTDRLTILQDTSRSDCHIQWLFRSTLAQTGNERSLCGVNIFLLGYFGKLDSVTVALEKQFRIPFFNIGQASQKTIYSASLNDCTTVFVSQCNPDERIPTGCIRIAIANHLSDEEKAYFSTHSSTLEPETD